MALVLKDRVKETTSTSGTGSITLLGAVQGFQGFSSIGEGNTTYYSIVGTTEWEVGIGTYSSGTLSRDTVLASSLNNTKVAFSSGVKDVFCTYAASKAVSTDTLPVTGATSTASPNATVNVASLSAAASSTNADLALVPKGEGALLSKIPDGASTGGNKRGRWAVDLQLLRNNADQVASGQTSTIGGGEYNKASGLDSTIGGGSYNITSGIASTVAGGSDNQATNSQATIAGGSGNRATATQSTVGGGRFNEATATYATIAGGYEIIASGEYASVIGGRVNTADASHSSVIGGAYGTTKGIVGYAVAPASNAPIQSKQGASQSGVLVLGVETTNATTTRLRSNSSASAATNQLALADNSALTVFGTVVANVTGGGDTAGWTFTATAKRGSGAASTTLIASNVTGVGNDTGASLWNIGVDVDTTNGCLLVEVVGQASTTIRWVATLYVAEVTY